jgi:hypothetical protein
MAVASETALVAARSILEDARTLAEIAEHSPGDIYSETRETIAEAAEMLNALMMRVGHKED